MSSSTLRILIKGQEDAQTNNHNNFTPIHLE
jgi:hypothetical protein